MTKKAKPSTEKMMDEVRDYLTRPDVLSSGRCRRLQEAFSRDDDDAIIAESGHILDEMLIEVRTRSMFNSFTPHRRCQVSLIREVLKDIWGKRQVNSVESSRLVEVSL